MLYTQTMDICMLPSHVTNMFASSSQILWFNQTHTWVQSCLDNHMHGRVPQARTHKINPLLGTFHMDKISGVLSICIMWVFSLTINSPAHFLVHISIYIHIYLINFPTVTTNAKFNLIDTHIFWIHSLHFCIFQQTQCSVSGYTVYTVYCCHANTTPILRSKVLQKLTIAQLVKKFTSYGTWRFIKLFT
jgi:hypothetical protein